MGFFLPAMIHIFYNTQKITVKVDAVKVDAVKVDAVKVDAVKVDAVKVDAVKVDAQLNLVISIDNLIVLRCGN